MEAEIDVDVICHLGFFRNVDLQHRGIYYVDVCLLYGEDHQKIHPIGMFSAPSRIESFVRRQKIPATPLVSMSQVESREMLFRSRSFVVRYKDEIHELNDGVHWRLTIPNMDLANGGAPVSTESLIIRFSLNLCQLLKHDGKSDLLKEIENYLPADPVYSVIATQDLQLAKIMSGNHHYFPVRFHRLNMVELDVMVHCAVTAVRYESVSLAAIGGISRRTTSSIGDCATPRSLKTVHDPMTSALEKDTPPDEEDASDGAGSKSMWYGESLSLETLQIEESYYSKEREYSPRAASSPSHVSPLQLNDSVVPPNDHTPPASVDGTEVDKILHTSASNESGSDDIMLADEAVFDTLCNSDTDDVIMPNTPPHTPTRISNPPSRRTLSTNITPESTKVKKTPTRSPRGFLPLRKNSSGSFGNKKSSGISIAMLSEESPRRQISLGSVFECDSRPRSVSAAGLEVHDIEKLLEAYSAPLICNYSLVSLGSQGMLERYALSRGVSKRETKFALIDSDNLQCYLEEYAQQILTELAASDSISGVMSALQQHLDQCNAQVSVRWSLLLQALPRVMPIIRDDMRMKYLTDIRVFWKGQAVVHTYNSSTMKPPSAVEETCLESLTTILKHESRSKKCRYLSLFDANVHKDAAKLPIMLIQQYVHSSSVLVSNSDNSDSGNTSLLGGSSSSTLTDLVERGGMLLGCRGDLRLLNICPDDISAQVFSALLESVQLDSDGSDALQQRFSEATLVNGIYRNSLARADSRNTDREDDILAVGDLFDGRNIFQALTLPPKGSLYQFDVKRNASDVGIVLDDEEETTHLIVLQHGYQGTSYDMRLLRNILQVEFPHDTLFLTATSNQECSGDSIAVMAQRLSAEIVKFCNDDVTYGRVSFIGHSAGGLIIRKCLECDAMIPLLPKLHAYVSLASPHLGTLYASSQLVSTGMWALFKLKKTPVLQELLLEDSPSDPTRSMVYKLSENGVLQFFRRVILVSSPKDHYVPLHSARIQMHPKAQLNAQLGSIIVSMAANLVAQIDAERLFRITLGNNTGDSYNVDTAIGRRAHVCFLDDQIVVEQLVYSLYPFFV